MRFFDNRGPFVIVIGQCAAHLSLAQRLAQDYFLYLACNSIILRDGEVPRQLEVLQRSNIVCIGNTEENSLSKLVLDQDKTIKAQHALFRVSEKVFNEMGTGKFRCRKRIHASNFTQRNNFDTQTPIQRFGSDHALNWS